jgi:integrase
VTAGHRIPERFAGAWSCRPRTGLPGVGFHTLRHTCASLLIESGLNVLRLQRWMGHHSPAFTLEVDGHLLDGDLGPALDLRREIRPGRQSRRQRGRSTRT